MNSHPNGSDRLHTIPHFKHSYSEGFEAAMLGLSKNSCLFQPGTLQFNAWNKGYDAAIEIEQDFSYEESVGDKLLVGLLIALVLVCVGLLILNH